MAQIILQNKISKTVASLIDRSIQSVNIPYGITQIADSAFRFCWYLSIVSIPDSVTYIGPSAFSFCPSLRNIVIPDSVTSIGEEAFINTSLSTITLSNNLVSISDKAFRSIGTLENITIPGSITQIGANAFNSCEKLVSVTVLAASPPTLGNGYVFSYASENLVIYVPSESVEAYKTATYWSNYASIIQAIPI